MSEAQVSQGVFGDMALAGPNGAPCCAINNAGRYALKISFRKVQRHPSSKDCEAPPSVKVLPGQSVVVWIRPGFIITVGQP